MLQKGFDFIKQSLALALVAGSAGLGYCGLLWLFPDTIEASDQMGSKLTSEWGGVESLFGLHSGVLGWLIVVLSGHRFGVTGVVLLLLALPWCFIAIVGGFAVAAVVVGPLPAATWELMFFCLVTNLASCVLRTYLDDAL